MSMARLRFIARVLAASILNRRSRLLLVIAALTLVSMLATTLVSVSSGIGERLGEGLKRFGANLTVAAPAGVAGSSAAGEQTIERFIEPARIESVLSQTPGVETYHARVELAQRVGEIDTTLIGMSAQEIGSAGWRIEGEVPSAGGLLAGRDIARRAGLSVGSTVDVGGVTWKVSGVLESGAAEDDALVVLLDDALALTGGAVSRYLVRAQADAVDDVVASLASALPGLEVRTLRQVAESEGRLLDRVRILLITVTLGVAISAAIAVGTTLNLVVLERGEEIGLLKAMGGTSGLVVAYFLLEQLSSALFAGITGFVVGTVAAELVSFTVFGSALPVSALALGAGVGIATAIVLVAGAVPVARAAGVESAQALRGL